MPVKQISACWEVLAPRKIRVIYTFPVADEDITDNGEVKYEEHLCLYMSQDVFLHLGEAPGLSTQSNT